MRFPVRNGSAEHFYRGAWVVALALAATSADAAAPLSSSFPDTRLNDVCFVDATHGWAVGDRGTVLHTEDGGETWRDRISEVACPLESVWFLDHKIGWAVGGAIEPYTHRASGVVLRTENGGRSWTPMKSPVPPLRKVRFVDDKNGWALGDASPLWPTGLFFSDSGGRGWKTAAGPRGPGWLTADMIDAQTGAVAGREGATAAVRRRGVMPTDMPCLGPRNLRGMVLVPPVYGWLIGDDGLVMMTGDAGKTWGMTPGPLPEDARQFDWHAIAVQGTHCWVAGDPGTRILHSPDAGRTWEFFDTKHTAPIRGLSFVDEKNGWAVGDFGTILQTKDGGTTWHRQKSGGTRAAVLGIFSRPERIPLELFAQLCADEGYLGVVEILNGDAAATEPDRASVEDRVHQAILAVGGAGSAVSQRFPLPEEDLAVKLDKTLGAWNAAHDGHAMDALRERLVRRIRTWRPSVIVTHAASPRGEAPLDHLINQAVFGAVRAAADPTAYSKQITQGGLKPWRVDKVYSALRDGSSATYELSTAQIGLHLGRSLADVADESRGLIRREATPVPETLRFRLALHQLPHEPTKPDPFNGIILHPGGEARRQVREAAAETLRAVHDAARQRRNMQAILSQAEQGDEDEGGNARLLASVKGLTEGMDAGGAGHALFQLGRHYARGGHPESAAETFELLTTQYPEHPVTPAAVTWLIQYYGSGEAQWRAARRRTKSSPRATTLVADMSRPEDREDRLARAVALGGKLRQTDPAMLARPEIGFPLAAVDRRRGSPKDAERFYLGRRRRATHDAWWATAEAEAWLLEPKGLPPKPILHCTRTTVRPTLDGKLDEPFWKAAKPAELKASNGEDGFAGGEVRFAYDTKFLYLGVRCTRPPGRKAVPITDEPRPRDGDLSKYDRVSVYLDLDRDYATYYRLTVDERGWTGEACFEDTTWNPGWFVAADSSEDQWTVEAAVPLHFLTAKTPTPSEVWAVGIQRIVPGVGLQSWTRPAGVEVRPEGFGYLMFR